MSSANLNENLQDSLNMLCTNLFSMLQETDKLLNIEKEKYKELKSVNVPWPVRKRKSIESIPSSCTCSSTQSGTVIPIASKHTDISLVEGIPRIVNKTKALRINPSKNNVVRFADAKKSIKDVIAERSKPDSVVTHKDSRTVKANCSKSTTSLLKTKRSSVDAVTTHSPSCMLYGSDTSKSRKKSLSYSNLSQAVSAYGVPTVLQKTLDDYYRFILDNDNVNIITKNARHSFIKNLNKQNESTWLEATNKLEKLSKYMSAVCSLEFRLKKQYEFPCVIYQHLKQLASYEKQKLNSQETDMWLNILETIQTHCLPTLFNTTLSEHEKIYVCKMFKAVCNYSKCRVPNVPLYKITQ